jgi:hypothetical protein
MHAERANSMLTQLVADSLLRRRGGGAASASAVPPLAERVRPAREMLATLAGAGGESGATEFDAGWDGGGTFVQAAMEVVAALERHAAAVRATTPPRALARGSPGKSPGRLQQADWSGES